MEHTRILLTVEHRLHSQLLKHFLTSRPDLKLVGETTNVIECLMLLSSKKPHLWIHSWEEGPELEAVLSHVYPRHPHLTIIRVSPNESAGLLQMQINSLPDLLTVATQSRRLLASA